MEFPLTKDRLAKCNPITSPVYPTIYCELLESHIMVGDFISISLPEGQHVIGRLINVCLLEDIPIAEVGTRDIDYFLLDNRMEKKMCRLLHIWRNFCVDTPGYERLSQVELYSLRGVQEVVESWIAMWFGIFSVENIVFIFHHIDMQSGTMSQLNGVENLLLPIIASRICQVMKYYHHLSLSRARTATPTARLAPFNTYKEKLTVSSSELACHRVIGAILAPSYLMSHF